MRSPALSCAECQQPEETLQTGEKEKPRTDVFPAASHALGAYLPPLLAWRYLEAHKANAISEFRPGPPSLCVFTRGQSLAEGQQPCLSCSQTWPGSWGMSPVLFSSLIWFTSAFSGGVPEGVPSSPAVLFSSWKHHCQGRDRSPWSHPAGLPRG